THDRPWPPAPSDRSAEDPADDGAEHRAAHRISPLVLDGLPDPGDLPEPFGRGRNPSGRPRLSRRAGCEWCEQHCCEVTVQVNAQFTTPVQAGMYSPGPERPWDGRDRLLAIGHRWRNTRSPALRTSRRGDCLAIAS